MGRPPFPKFYTRFLKSARACEKEFWNGLSENEHRKKGVRLGRRLKGRDWMSGLSVLALIEHGYWDCDCSCKEKYASS